MFWAQPMPGFGRRAPRPIRAEASGVGILGRAGHVYTAANSTKPSGRIQLFAQLLFIPAHEALRSRTLLAEPGS